MMNEYGNNLKAVNKTTLEEISIPYLHDLEFVKWPTEEAYDETLSATYEISGYPADIEIYSLNRFSYNDKMYKVISTQDFSDLF